MTEPRCLGIDFGTDSVRVLLVRADTGAQEKCVVVKYPRWSMGCYCEPSKNLFRQHPLDYTQSVEQACKELVEGFSSTQLNDIIGIGVDTTGSTVCAIDEAGVPLSFDRRFEENPNAMFLLWKDHSAVEEAADINNLAHTWNGPNYTMFEGNTYSPEWFWAKILHVLRSDKAIAESTYYWCEHCDWMPGLFVGVTVPDTMSRGRAAAGHKAMWHKSWGGLPSANFLNRLDPRLTKIRNHLYNESITADQCVGRLNSEWAARLGLPSGIPVAAGSLDAHSAAVGGGIRPGTLAKIVGTSTCDMVVVRPEEIGTSVLSGICGQVDGSIIPDMVGLEAGQSAFGDVYAWFRDLLCWPARNFSQEKKARMEQSILDELGLAASRLAIDPDDVISLDWFNGRRSPNLNATLKAAITGLSLSSDAPVIYRSLVEATAYGSRAISDHMKSAGINVDETIALGGIAQRSPYCVQILANVLGQPIKVAATQEGSALGAAMFASVAAGYHGTVESAQTTMGAGFSMIYEPSSKGEIRYSQGYKRYCELSAQVEAATSRWCGH